MSPMLTINRTVLIVTVRQPFVDWLRSLPDGGDSIGSITVDEVNEDCSAYLIPEFDTPEETENYFGRNKSELFEEALCGWHTDEALWPKRRSAKVFDEWFSVQFHTVVYDLDTRAPLAHDDD